MATNELQQTDEEMKSAIDVFYPILTQILTSAELVSSSKLKKLFDQDEVRMIKCSKDKEEEKVRKLLDLIGQSKSEERWDIFNNVLSDLGFLFIQKSLQKHHTAATKIQMKKIVSGLHDIDIETKPLSQILHTNGLITDIDVQDIDTEAVNMDDEKAALIVLIDRLVTPPPDDWFDEFLKCLCEAGHEEAVKQMKEDVDEKEEDTKAVSTNFSISDHWRKLVMEVFYSHIVDNVKATEILINMTSIFEMKEVQAIRKKARYETDEEAMQLLLKTFDEKDDLGKWMVFRQALVEADYKWIIKLLEEGSVDIYQQEIWKNMIRLFAKKLVTKMIPNQIVYQLHARQLISEEEKEEIVKEQSHKCDTSAAWLLLACLPKRHPKWYPEFMEVLFLEGWDETVCEIDSDEWKRLNQKHSDMMSENSQYYADPSFNTEKRCTKKTMPDKLEESEIKEQHMSYTEKPERSNNNLSSPNRLEQDDGQLLHDSTMQELSIENNLGNDENDEVTQEKQMFSITPSKLPPPARRGQSYQSIPNTSEMSASPSTSSESGHVQPDSLMLNEVKKNLDLEVAGEPELYNIQGNPFENIAQAEDTDSEEEENLPKDPLNLRSYQKELAAPGIQGINCIIVAPTGSGKTHVALKIIQVHMADMKARRHPKVIFLVEQGALANQQAGACQKYLPYKVKLITGETQRIERHKTFSEWLRKRDILVVTAQLLVNALSEGDVQISDFTLMVFDECHHAHAKHAYNEIMMRYMDLKLNNEAKRNSLPMIVGLTASVGVGRAKTLDGAKQWIKTMMANMDAEELATVKDNVVELSEHVIVPEQMIKRTAPRKKNYFGEALGKIMEVTERYMKQSIYAESIKDKDKVMKAPPSKGSDQYTQWISFLWRETAKVFNQEARRFFTTCRSYLDLYNRALIIYEDARVKDALEFLEEHIKRINEHIIPDETDKKMMSLYTKSKALLEHCVDDVNHKNPKLETLKQMIANTYKENLDSRGIIFVKTRDLVNAIQNWMKETEGLKLLNPIKFVGAQASGEKGGMTKNDQDNILHLFREGKHKLIIATSVAEEGLDIQKCNLVIRYDHVTNEIAMVQARGRGRAEGSQYFVVAGEDKMTAEKEELNMMREARMNEAIEQLQVEIQNSRRKFLKEIEDLQMEANIQRELENTTKGGRIVGDYEFEMRCGKCNQFICMSTDIKKIMNAHHAVIGEEITKHITTIRVPKPTFEDDNIKMGVGKVNCSKCGKNLGNIVIYKKAQFPVLKIENFVVSDSYSNTDVYKKWKKAPFVPVELSSKDLLERARGQQYVFEN